MPAIIKKPQLTNRGGAGLLAKLPHQEGVPALQRKTGPDLWASAPKDYIRCEGVVVDISTLTPDLNNARMHPERNMEAIKDSICLHGQTTPLVVRKEGMIIVAGNGRCDGMKELGWTKVAVSLLDMTEGEAAAYGLTDNRTAELAKWDFEVVARLEKLATEAGHEMVGWSDDELSVLRAADWSPPAIDSGYGVGSTQKPLLVSFTPDQYELLSPAIQLIKQEFEDEEMDDAECIVQLALILKQSREGNAPDQETTTVDAGCNGSV